MAFELWNRGSGAPMQKTLQKTLQNIVVKILAGFPSIACRLYKEMAIHRHIDLRERVVAIVTFHTGRPTDIHRSWEREGREERRPFFSKVRFYIHDARPPPRCYGQQTITRECWCDTQLRLSASCNKVVRKVIRANEASIG